MSSLQTMVAADRVRDLNATIVFRVGEEGCRARASRDGIALKRGEPIGPDVIFISTSHAMAAVIYAGQPLVATEASGAVRVQGDRSVPRRFMTLFPLTATGG